MKKIIEFQKSKGLTQDGIIGPKTLEAFKQHLNINSIELANFLGQLYHETGGFKYDTESLNYSVQGLIKTFNYYKRNQVEAWKDGRFLTRSANQVEIANKVYWDVNRDKSHWLGNKIYGDGWKYRGRGAIMITGRYNYAAFENYIGYNILEHPALVSDYLYWESALWFFEKNYLWVLANDNSIKSITELTRRINGGLNGIDERIRMTRYYSRILGV